VRDEVVRKCDVDGFRDEAFDKVEATLREKWPEWRHLSIEVAGLYVSAVPVWELSEWMREREGEKGEWWEVNEIKVREDVFWKEKVKVYNKSALLVESWVPNFL